MELQSAAECFLDQMGTLEQHVVIGARAGERAKALDDRVLPTRDPVHLAILESVTRNCELAWSNPLVSCYHLVNEGPYSQEVRRRDSPARERVEDRAAEG